MREPDAFGRGWVSRRFWILPDDGEAMESAVVAGAKDSGGAAVPAGLRLRRLGRGGVRGVNLAVFLL